MLSPDRNCRSARWACLLTLAAAVPALGLLGARPAQKNDPKKEPEKGVSDYYVVGGKKFPLTIIPNQVGVVINPGSDAKKALDQLVGFAKSNNVQVVKTYEDGVAILRVDGRDPAALEAVAANLRDKGRGVLRKVGLVVVEEKAKAPMILPDEVVVQFKAKTTDEEVAKFAKDNRLEKLRQNPSRKTQYTFRVGPRADLKGEGSHVLRAAEAVQKRDLVEYAQPNFVRVRDIRQPPLPNDPLFGQQWHLHNTGQGGGTADADIDAPEAWQISRGADGILIAVIDNGFDVTHADLVPNLWVNAGEVPGNGVDDDGNGYVDDVNGWNFSANNGNLVGGAHGTNVAGCVGARGGNQAGVSGSCPVCRLMLVRMGSGDAADGEAFDYARTMGAHVITNSWGYSVTPAGNPVVINAINDAAANGRGGRGCVVFFAMNNPNFNDCVVPVDISALDSVIAVSRATAQDRFDQSGFGNCMDLLAPSRSQMTAGLPGITTTSPGGGFTANFGGTSAATPITAGIAGLILEVEPILTRVQVQQLLQDTADKVEDSAGAYSALSGFSSPASGIATHGHGRVNAFEAVRVAAPVARQGRGGRDLVLRDNRLDWGNTEQPSNTLFEPTRGFIPHWQSPDIKVDAPPYQATQPATSAEFDALTDEDPVAEKENRVYVRVRNRGPATVAAAKLKLHWAFAGTALPALPADFWTQFPNDSADTSQWHPIATKDLTDVKYSGGSVAATPQDEAKVVQFVWKAPALDPTMPAFQHYCVLAIVDSPQDGVSAASKASLVPDEITPRDNNVTHRNLVLQPPVRDGRYELGLFVRNPTKEAVRTTLRVTAPQGWRVAFDKKEFGEAIPLKGGEDRPLILTVTPPMQGAVGEVTVLQEIPLGKNPLVGGITYRFGTPTGSGREGKE